MRLVNHSENNLMHNGEILFVGETKEISDNVAKIWLKISGIEEVITKEDVKKAVKEAKNKKK